MNNLAHDIVNTERTKDVLINENVTFESLLLPPNLLKGLSNNGFRKPSPIQLKAIPLGRIGFDLIVKAKSGTGKTAVFGLLGLEVVDLSESNLQVLILAPTREIAVQIREVVTSLGECLDGLKISSFIGGYPEIADTDKCHGCQIAVGTPGRIKSLLKQRIMNADYLRLLVLDEADKIMETNMHQEVNEIFNLLPIRKQVVVASATYTEPLEQFLKSYMKSPCFVSADQDTPLLLGLKLFVKVVDESVTPSLEMRNKNRDLFDILHKVSFTQCLIFLNHQNKAQSLSSALNRNGFKSTYISGSQKQDQRLKAINDLKSFKCKILTSTDLTARGIDVANVDLVINYDIPVDVMTYLHRMGRAGRYGSKGICITLATMGAQLNQLENYLSRIGVVNISKLPDLSDPTDLWDSTEFEEITVKNLNPTNDLKEDILNLKSNDEKINRKRSKCKGWNNKDETVLMEKDVHNSDNETSLSRGNLNDIHNAEEIKEEVEEEVTIPPRTRSMLEELSSGNFDFLNGERDASEKGDEEKEKIFDKNVAFYEAAKILSDQTKRLDHSVVEHMSNYIRVLRNTRNIETDTRNENFYEAAFEYNLDQNKPHWSKFVPDVENKSMKEVINDESPPTVPDIFKWVPVDSIPKPTINKVINLLASSSDDDDVPNTEELIKNEDVVEADELFTNEEYRPNTAHSSVLEEQRSRLEPLDQESHDHFSFYFDRESRQLWKYGTCFDSVDKFDDWFAKWRDHVKSVTEYTRQNLYVRELNCCRNDHG